MNKPLQPHESTPELTTERPANRKEAVRDFVEGELEKFVPEIEALLELRHELFEVEGTDYSTDYPIRYQLYEDPRYSAELIRSDVGLRKGNTLPYHVTTEQYDRGLSDEHAERDFVYRQAILRVAQKLGFVSKYPGEASDPIDRNIGITDSQLEPIEEKVAAVVINGAAGMSNVKRVRNAIRNIEAGLIDTDHIIITAGTRPVGEAEKERLKPPFRAGDTEFELMKQAVTDLTGVDFDDDTVVVPVTYGDNLKEKVESVVVNIGDRLVTIRVAEAPFDANRKLDGGLPATRINTEEAFLAALPLLEGIDGAVVMQSHDTWTPWQNLIGHEVFGLIDNRAVYPAGPFNAERMYVAEQDGTQVIDIDKPQDVIDEIAKTYQQLAVMSARLRDEQ